MPPSSTNQNIIASGSGRLPSKKKKILIIIALIVIAVTLIVSGVYWWMMHQKNQVSLADQLAADQLADKVKVDREQLYKVPPYDDSAEQRFLTLVGNSVAAQGAGEWSQLEVFSKESLAIEGYETDINTLTRLALAYEKQNKTTERRQTLVILKKSYESAGRTDSEEYKAIVKEVG